MFQTFIQQRILVADVLDFRFQSSAGLNIKTGISFDYGVKSFLL
jgi:hypothetical protein